MSTLAKASPEHAPAEAPIAVVAPIALVTGAARRIGRTIALALAEAGYDIVVHFNASASDAQDTVDAIRARGRRAVAVGANLSVEEEVGTLLARAADALGEVSCVVNNASQFDFDDAQHFNYATLTHLMQVNLCAPVALARILHARLSRIDGAPTGVVVNVLDQKLFNPNPDFLSYTLTKAALHEATTLLAQALAPQVRVVGVAPGLTLASSTQTDAGFGAAHAATPLGHSSTPDDIAQAVCYLVTARAVTGTTLIVDGGQHLVPSARDVMFLTEGK